MTSSLKESFQLCEKISDSSKGNKKKKKKEAENG